MHSARKAEQVWADLLPPAPRPLHADIHSTAGRPPGCQQPPVQCDRRGRGCWLCAKRFAMPGAPLHVGGPLAASLCACNPNTRRLLPQALPPCAPATLQWCIPGIWRGLPPLPTSLEYRLTTGAQAGWGGCRQDSDSVLRGCSQLWGADDALTVYNAAATPGSPQGGSSCAGRRVLAYGQCSAPQRPAAADRAGSARQRRLQPAGARCACKRQAAAWCCRGQLMLPKQGLTECIQWRGKVALQNGAANR